MSDAPDELARLRAEVEALRGRLDTRAKRPAPRSAIAAVTIAVAALLAVASVVGLWAARTVLDTKRWVATVAPLPEDPRVSAALAQFTTDEVFEALDVGRRLRDVLPARVDFVVAPLTDQVRGYVREHVDAALRSDRFADLWIEANRRAHGHALAILEGTSPIVSAQGDRVTIDLLPIVTAVLRELDERLALPDPRSGDLKAAVERALGAALPDDFAQFTVYDAGRLGALQEAFLAAKRGVVLLAALALLALGLALVVSPRRRRTVLQFGAWLTVAAVAVTAVLRAARADLVDRVPAGTYRDGVAAAITIITATLRHRGTQIMVLGLLIAVAMYLAGPGRIPVRLRHRVAAGARRLPAWIARHRDAIRIAGAAVAAVAALAWPSWTALLLLTAALAAFELAVTLLVRAQVPRLTRLSARPPPTQRR